MPPLAEECLWQRCAGPLLNSSLCMAGWRKYLKKLYWRVNTFEKCFLRMKIIPRKMLVKNSFHFRMYEMSKGITTNLFFFMCKTFLPYDLVSPATYYSMAYLRSDQSGLALMRGLSIPISAVGETINRHYSGLIHRDTNTVCWNISVNRFTNCP